MLKNLLIKIFGGNQQKDSTSKMLNPSVEVQPLSTSLDDNLLTLRKTMENCADIVFRQFIVPSPSNKVNAVIVYVEGLCDPKSISADLLKPLFSDLKDLESSSLDHASLHEVILEQVLSLTDAQTTANMLELVVPCTFVSLLQATEDYYNLSIFATFVRIIRFIALNIALLLPAFTVAFFSFHQELIPTTFLTNVASARQDLPMPIAAEVLLMEITFELLREAGIRLPKAIGQAVSTVGGLVIGQAAVNAGYVAPVPVIVVAMTAIASFTIPSYSAGVSIRILRFFLLVCASILGGVGIILGLMAILVHLCSLRSFGVPYLSPFAPLSPTDLKDTFIRVPWWAMIVRPRLIGNKEPIREDNAQGPTKPDKRGKES